MYHVYIIFSAKINKYYIGYSSDINKRLAEHNTGISDYTSKTSDWILKYHETFDSREMAMKREKEIKNKKSRKYIEWLISSMS